MGIWGVKQRARPWVVVDAGSGTGIVRFEFG